MDEEIRIPVSLPLDDDGYLRRECPNCHEQFKQYALDTEHSEAETLDQLFCPRCGQPAAADEWATEEQRDHGLGLLGPEADRMVQDALADMFKGVKGLNFKPNRNFSLDIPVAEPLTEPNDMVAVEPPCHPGEPIKVPETATGRIHCLICGSPFAA